MAALAQGGDFRFEVVAAEGGAEPIGLPGGIVFVPAAFLAAAEEEAEVAVMMAHAMGHVSLRHGFVNAPRAKEGTIPLFFMGGWMDGDARECEGSEIVSSCGFFWVHEEQQIGGGPVRSSFECLAEALGDFGILRGYAGRNQHHPYGDFDGDARLIWATLPTSISSARRAGLSTYLEHGASMARS